MTPSNSLIDLLESILLKLADQEYAEANPLVQQLIAEGDLHRKPTWAAHMTPTIEAPALLGQLLAGRHNGNLLSAELYPCLAKIESQLIDWFCQVFQQPFAHFTHGATYSNLEALWQAREQSSGDSTIVYGSQASHYSIYKACQILGLTFKPIPTNQQGVMLISELEQACQLHAPVAIVATAGSPSCGAIDPIASCIKLAKQYCCWCHIDAAWGGALMLTKKAVLLTGLNEANSVSFDPHKALEQPKPCGVLLYQQALHALSDVDYLFQAPKKTLPGSYGGELFLPLWCSLLMSGKAGLIKQLTERLEQAEQFYCLLKQKTDWWLQHSPVGIVCFRPSSACDFSALIKQGCISISEVNHSPVYRVVFNSHSVSAKQLIVELEQYF